MFGLVMSEDRISVQKRRSDIIEALQKLPQDIKNVLKVDGEV